MIEVWRQCGHVDVREAIFDDCPDRLDRPLVAQQRRDVVAVQGERYAVWNGHAGESEHARVELNERDVLVDAPPDLPTKGPGDDQRHASGPLAHGALEPHAVLTTHVAVIAGHNHHCVLAQPEAPEIVHHIAHLAVEVGHHGVVPTSGTVDIGVSEADGISPMVGVDPDVRPVGLIARGWRGGHREVDVVVPVSVLRRDQRWIVRMGVGDAEEPGRPAPVRR
jgi:hypothetical protein